MDKEELQKVQNSSSAFWEGTSVDLKTKGFKAFQSHK